jgi:putative N6-adenine-specific DNA methylase
MTSAFTLFAACQPGIEDVLAGELRALAIADPSTLQGGVAFRGDVVAAMRCALWLGTASHVLLRVAEFRCRALGELQRKVSELPWRAWLRPNVPLGVHATTKNSRVYHTGAAEERVSSAVAAALDRAPPARTPADELCARVHVRFRDDVCTISLDATSTPLHRRGYRLDGSKAPLREDLAHALVLASGFGDGDALLDPLCGAGTIAIEAAGIALGLPPGRLRPPPLEHLALFDSGAWHQVRTTSPPRRPVAAHAAIRGSDRDAGAIAAARANAARAGIGDHVVFAQEALAANAWLQPDEAPERGVLATNPPFGRRVGKEHALLPLYQTLGHRAARLGPGWRVALLAHDVRLTRRTGLPLRAAFTTRHGGLTVTALVAGDARPRVEPQHPR